MAIESDRPNELQVAVDHARARAQSSGELHLTTVGSLVPVSEELAAFVVRVLRDGTYHEAIARLVAEDPELADS